MAKAVAAAAGGAKRRINVVWFKCTDLRTHDHAALKAAHADGLPVLHLYVFDPFWHANTTRVCGFPKTGALRTRFQLEALADLGTSLEAAGHQLCTRSGLSTAACFEELCSDFAVNAVFAFHEICSEELSVERKVKEVLRRRGHVPLRLFWGFELHHFDDLGFDPRRQRGALSSYTAFRKRAEEKSRVRPSAQGTPVFARGPGSAAAWPRADAALPSVQEAMGHTYDPALDPGEGKDPRAELRWRGGETAALARVRNFLWEDDALGLDYVGATMTTDPAKSCMRDKAMSKLSPWLAHGCLSPRLLYEEVKSYERERRKSKGTHWIVHELIWRDYVRFASLFFGTSIFKIGGPFNVNPSWPWSTNKQALHTWKDGNTGFPFLDCFMRELKVTGYCNHMGRECSGWFLIGDLGLDWRMGAEWFESVLLDYEPTANWFNWTYRCLTDAVKGGGAAPGERLQGVQILRWGTQHDPDATYIKRWLPELTSLPATVAREPWLLELGQSGNLRPPPTGRFDVPRKALQAVLAMGFEEQDAAIAVYRTSGDADAAVALLVAEAEEEYEGGGGVEDGDQDEQEDLAQAIALSLQGAGPAAARPPAVAGGQQASAAGSFRYGVDYPRPMLTPVSLRNTQAEEASARTAQAERDRQLVRQHAAAARVRGGGSFGGSGAAPDTKRGYHKALAHEGGGGGVGGAAPDLKRNNKERWSQPRQRLPVGDEDPGPVKGGGGGGGGGEVGGGAADAAPAAESHRKRRWGGAARPAAVAVA